MERKLSYLIVDDDRAIVKLISEALTLQPFTFQVFSALNAEDALSILERESIDIMVVDILLPGISGIDLLKKVLQKYENISSIMISGYSDIDKVSQALKLGVYDYIIKPINIEEFLHTLSRLVERIHLLDEKKLYVQTLEARVKEATENLASMFYEVLSSTIYILEARDINTLRHSQDVAWYAEMLGKELGLADDQLDKLRMGGILHDIGKVGLKDEILFKPGKLTPEEYAIVKQHPVIGKKIIYPINQFDRDVLDIVYSHHEWWNGSGYPEGKRGEAIPFLARITAIADAYSAMVAARVYKPAKKPEEALEELKNFSGIQFDPELVPVFCKAIEKNILSKKGE
ncbi:HD-GYP domain-containing protein [Thermospira aquatica]|uniref:Response regulator n=1 Tax=Thermospira aquatica TaxID=2828656 RepID=A0AAX3BA03_9SPIR|nr:HD domain-containing phosphohydrolase [Thermospira aquatica]URA09070.1 response regulator [Thermospira aquatica]